MSFVYIILLIVIIGIAISLKIKFEFHFDSNNFDLEKIDLKIKIYIFKILKIFDMKNINVLKIISNNDKKRKKLTITRDDMKKILECVYVNSLNMNLGFNSCSIHINSYVLPIFNALFAMYISKNSKNINQDNVRYITYISKKFFYLDLFMDININNIKIIYVILKLVLNKKMKEINLKNNKYSVNYTNIGK